MTRYPNPSGLSVVDCSGVQIGNSDLADSCEWVPTVIPENARECLPGREHMIGVEIKTSEGQG